MGGELITVYECLIMQGTIHTLVPESLTSSLSGKQDASPHFSDDKTGSGWNSDLLKVKGSRGDWKPGLLSWAPPSPLSTSLPGPHPVP